MKKNMLFLWCAISVIWVGFAFIFIYPHDAPVRIWVFVLICAVIPALAAIILLFLFTLNDDLFAGVERAAPVGGAILAIFAFFGYLITASEEARRPYLERQLDSCANLSDTVGQIATLKNDDSNRPIAMTRFFAYQNGVVGVYGTGTLEWILVDFADTLYTMNSEVVQNASRCIARICKVQAQDAWAIIPGLIRTNVDRTDRNCKTLVDEFEKFCATPDGKDHWECGTRFDD